MTEQETSINPDIALMINLKFLIIIILGSCCLKATAQHCDMAYLGTKTLYKAPVKKPAPIPTGYEAVFINYVGRHGARHLTKEVSTYFGYQLLNRADSAAMLTDDGIKLRELLFKLNKIEHSDIKSISAEGREELRELGKRLYLDNTTVFTRPVGINVALTKEIRTKQSADAFLAGLKSELKDSTLIKERNDNTNLRFYDLSPGYTNFEQKGAWLVPFDSLKKEIHLESMEQHIAARWLKPGFLQKLTYAETDRLINDVFSFENITYSVAKEAEVLGYHANDLDFKSIFTCEELTALGKLDNADGYYKKGPGLKVDGIQVGIAAPLLADFITTTDAFLRSHQVNAELRFAHAETIAPFAAILGIENAAKVSGKVAGVEKTWKAAEVIPLSANIQWIVYRNAKNEILVKFLLNENEVRIFGLQPAQGIYYSWNNVRTFYMDKLKRMGAPLTGDMKRYLADLK